ncbi:MAG: TonB-dependent receptor, partial [Cytophagales bacterium]
SNWLYVDASAYMLNYRNRIGEIFTTRGDRFRTNVGNSRTLGFELVAEIDLFSLMKFNEKNGSLSVFGNYSFNHARYVSSDKELFNNTAVGNRIEMVPTFTFRGGINYKWKNLNCGLQYSRVGEQYTDASNALGPIPGSHIGLVPEYFVVDFTAKYTFKKIYTAECSVNNLTNNLYFTRRAEGYPGPGILPSDPRLFYLTLGVKI